MTQDELQQKLEEMQNEEQTEHEQEEKQESKSVFFLKMPLVNKFLILYEKKFIFVSHRFIYIFAIFFAFSLDCGK